jgi:CRP-like cAMP-binding protein
LLQSLAEETLRKLETICDWKSYAAGDVIIEHGSVGTEVFFITSGSAHVLHHTESGRVISFARVDGGNLFGELAAIDGRPRSATVAAEQACEVAVMGAEEFRKHLMSEPLVARSLMERFVGIIRRSDENIFDIVSLGAQERICLLLLRLAKVAQKGDEEMSIDPCPPQTVIAGDAHTTRETAARTIGRLQAKKIVKRSGPALIIVDRRQLEAIALQNEKLD